jgi:hypothetical protein
MGYAAHAGSETGAAWVIQQLREAFPYDTAPRYLIFDRDAIFSPAVVTVVRAMGIKPRGIAYRSPWQNGVAERWIGSCRRQLLEHVVGATSFGSYAPTSATITRTVVIWDWARTPHTNDLFIANSGPMSSNKASRSIPSASHAKAVCSSKIASNPASQSL